MNYSVKALLLLTALYNNAVIAGDVFSQYSQSPFTHREIEEEKATSLKTSDTDTLGIFVQIIWFIYSSLKGGKPIHPKHLSYKA